MRTPLFSRRLHDNARPRTRAFPCSRARCRFPALMAASVGSRPTMPYNGGHNDVRAAFRGRRRSDRPCRSAPRMSVSASFTRNALSPRSSVERAHHFRVAGARACSSSKPMRRLVVSAHDFSLDRRAYRTVCVPIEPVEPKIAIFFIIYAPETAECSDDWIALSEYDRGTEIPRTARQRSRCRSGRARRRDPGKYGRSP